MTAVLAPVYKDSAPQGHAVSTPQLRLVHNSEAIASSPSGREIDPNLLQELRDLAPSHPALRPYSTPHATAVSSRAYRFDLGKLLQVALFALAALAVVFVGMLVGAWLGPDMAQAPVDYLVHTVLPGDTLWSVAQSNAGALPTDEMLSRLMSLNDLDAASVLQSGQQILVPVF